MARCEDQRGFSRHAAGWCVRSQCRAIPLTGVHDEGISVFMKMSERRPLVSSHECMHALSARCADINPLSEHASRRNRNSHQLQPSLHSNLPVLIRRMRIRRAAMVSSSAIFPPRHVTDAFARTPVTPSVVLRYIGA